MEMQMKIEQRGGREHDAIIKELQSLAQEKEHQSYMLKWAGENNAKQYLLD